MSGLTQAWILVEKLSSSLHTGISVASVYVMGH